MAKRGWFTARPDRVRRKWLAIGLALVVAGVAVIVAAAGPTTWARCRSLLPWPGWC